jgi:hypothetical protein
MSQNEPAPDRGTALERPQIEPAPNRGIAVEGAQIEPAADPGIVVERPRNQPVPDHGIAVERPGNPPVPDRGIAGAAARHQTQPAPDRGGIAEAAARPVPELRERVPGVSRVNHEEEEGEREEEIWLREKLVELRLLFPDISPDWLNSKIEGTPYWKLKVSYIFLGVTYTIALAFRYGILYSSNTGSTVQYTSTHF